MYFPIEQLRNISTPFYYYDMELLRRTAAEAMRQAARYGVKIHYALKANANPPLLRMLSAMGFGADCVSGNEVQRATECGFAAEGIAFAGAGKTDDEIRLGISSNIWCFNCESGQELETIEQIAAQQGTVARIALRINPGVDAHTHRYITTGDSENKFGFQPWQIGETMAFIKNAKHLEMVGVHFHIGSQITDMEVFAALCRRVNEIIAEYHINTPNINLGGGLGVDYDAPDEHPVPLFEEYFAAISRHLKVQAGQTIHTELGRSIVAQCGALISRALYVKPLRHKTFVILDAGMSDLIRPALYGARHAIFNLTSAASERHLYDIVGPICETSDSFAQDVTLPATQRGDLLALRTAGAYGEVMASQYNLRKLPTAVYSVNILPNSV